MIVAFTGHRPDKLGGYGPYNPVKERVVASLHARLSVLRIEYTALRGLSGMALGFDQWAAQVCRALKVPYEVILPFTGQEACWPLPSQEIYRDLVQHATKVVVVSGEGYQSWKMQKRNQYLVDNCDLLIAAWDPVPWWNRELYSLRTPGGSPNRVFGVVMADETMEEFKACSDEQYEVLYRGIIQVFMDSALKSFAKKHAKGELFPKFSDGDGFELTYTAQFRPEDIRLLAARLGITLPKIRLVTL